MAAQKLQQMLQKAETSDDHDEGDYLDAGSKIRMGIQNGIPDYVEEYCEDIPALW